ncbi:AsmA family protein [Aggregatibacter actinomycetemcomitans]|uniref:AsmA-like C-terminal region-containing protein n=1 Tax=Aggregatibacter actinomycetemcomitans TaxID=714 RepID=UPI0011DD5A0E|nr:AsmA-like C-terminal region-containing protein [Aggregatibacter actinomycetemcomitans]QEH46055.1 hypothetical protein FXN58_11365 [Aggregatibacter actinomycetemcomitans]QEH50082.1 hypothetical protein FXN57_11180 [Aggregatibacter actinomycetemcomitans]
MKKIAIIAVVVILAIFAFFYVQIQKLETVVYAKLAQHETTFQAFNLGFFPQPYLAFENVKHNQISIEKLTGKFPLSALFSGNVKLQALEIQNAKWSENAQNSADIQMRFSDFSLDNVSSDGIVFSGDNSVTVELAKPLYGSNKTFNFRFINGVLQRSDERKFTAQFDHAVLNEETLGFIQADLDLSQYTKHLTADINSYCLPDSPCTARLDYVSEPEKSAVGFSAKNYPLERLLTWLTFPKTITGNADVDIAVQFAHSQIIDGKFYFDARNGELLGLNLLELAGRHLPINWDASALKGRNNINTKYDQMTSSFRLQGHQLDIEKMILKTTALLGEGRGRVNLQSMQCYVDLNLRPTDEKYTDIVLPIHFFNSCYSPQYEVNIDKAFRNKIKELLRRKLKQ